MHQPAAKPIPWSSHAIAVARRLDALAIGVLVLTGVVAAATFRDYGLGWDDYTHSQYGDLLVSLYSSGFADKRALSFVNLYMYGGGFDLLSALAAKILPFGLFETRRLVGAAVGIVGLFVTWRLGRRLGGPLAGLIGLILLATCPLYYGHMFINAKDGPFAVTSVIALLGIVRAFEEYPRATPATVALCGIGVGLAVGSRVMGGFAVLDALLPLLFIVAVRSRASAPKPALAECGSFLLAFLPGVILAYLVMGLVWPWSVVAPLNPFHAVEYFSNFFEKPWRELFDGQLIPVPDMPRSYVPTLIALQLPEMLLVLGLCGIGRRDRRRGRRATAAAQPDTARRFLPSCSPPRCQFSSPSRRGRRCITASATSSSWCRRLPCSAALPGLGSRAGLKRLGRAALAAGALVLFVGAVSPVIAMVRLHPYEYTHFNRIAGGVAGARPRYMLDYWGLSLTQASQQLRALLAARGEQPSRGTWTVAVCGPHPPVTVALGPQFTTTWNPKGADFAMMLGEFYCAKLDAPVLFEIVRDGVVYARVYDIRGRSISTLLTVPGIDQQ